MSSSRSLRAPKQRGCKSVTTDWAHHVRSPSGLITTVVMTLFTSIILSVSLIESISSKKSLIHQHDTFIFMHLVRVIQGHTLNMIKHQVNTLPAPDLGWWPFQLLMLVFSYCFDVGFVIIVISLSVILLVNLAWLNSVPEVSKLASTYQTIFISHGLRGWLQGS